MCGIEEFNDKKLQNIKYRKMKSDAKNWLSKYEKYLIKIEK